LWQLHLGGPGRIMNLRLLSRRARNREQRLREGGGKKKDGCPKFLRSGAVGHEKRGRHMQHALKGKKKRELEGKKTGRGDESKDKKKTGEQRRKKKGKGMKGKRFAKKMKSLQRKHGKGGGDWGGWWKSQCQAPRRSRIRWEGRENAGEPEGGKIKQKNLQPFFLVGGGGGLQREKVKKRREKEKKHTKGKTRTRKAKVVKVFR